jgi:hypothetical protein
LHQVLGLASVVQYAYGNAEHQLGVTVEEKLQRLMIALLKAIHRIFVAVDPRCLQRRTVSLSQQNGERRNPGSKGAAHRESDPANRTPDTFVSAGGAT